MRECPLSTIGVHLEEKSELDLPPFGIENSPNFGLVTINDWMK
jgi:hypothetical protein